MCCFFEPRHRFSLEALLAARSDTASSSRRRRSLAAPRIDLSVTVVDNRRIPLLHNSPEDAFLKRDGGDRRSDNGGGSTTLPGMTFCEFRGSQRRGRSRWDPRQADARYLPDLVVAGER